MRKESEKEWIYLDHFAICLKLTQRWKKNYTPIKKQNNNKKKPLKNPFKEYFVPR